MSSLFRRISDNTTPGSLAWKMRRQRFNLFYSLLRSFHHQGKIHVLDLGGDNNYWKYVLPIVDLPIEVTLLNVKPYPDTGDPRINSIAGDARNLSQYADGSVDVIHSNSLIEHLGPFHEQSNMASEVRRVGRSYFIQTPNRYFPIEPHFLLPFVQFLPVTTRISLAKKYQPGWYRTLRKELAIEDARTVRLLTKGELAVLFPDGVIWQEQFFSLTKSFVVYRFPGSSDQAC